MMWKQDWLAYDLSVREISSRVPRKLAEWAELVINRPRVSSKDNYQLPAILQRDVEGERFRRWLNFAHVRGETLQVLS